MRVIDAPGWDELQDAWYECNMVAVTLELSTGDLITLEGLLVVKDCSETLRLKPGYTEADVPEEDDEDYEESDKFYEPESSQFLFDLWDGEVDWHFEFRWHWDSQGNVHVERKVTGFDTPDENLPEIRERENMALKRQLEAESQNEID